MALIDADTLNKARDRLLKGDVVGIPTETVYGLAASIESEAGLRKIFSLKSRPFFYPLIVHVASLKQAQSLVREWPPLADFLARIFWPGPLTLVLPRAEAVNELITSGLETVALRMPAHPVALDLIKITGVPLAAPSANRFGRTSPSRAEHVKSEFQGADLLVIDGGECDVGVESTVISVEERADGSGLVQILRPGGVTEEMLTKKLEMWSKPVSVAKTASEASPGHLKHHYMPDIPLVIVRLDEQAGLSKATKLEVERVSGKKIARAVELVLDEDPTQAARELYAELRRLAKTGADAIYVHEPESTDGLWAAIWDRLSRAASVDLR